MNSVETKVGLVLLMMFMLALLIVGAGCVNSYSDYIDAG